MIKYIYKQPVFHILLIVLIGSIAYSNTFDASFQFDDIIAISDNPLIKDLRYFTHPSEAKELLGPDSHLYSMLKNRYIGMLTFALNYKFNGPNVTGYHAVNLTIHILNALLVYFILLLTFRTPRLKDACSAETAKQIALFSGLLFVSHPLQTQAVTYIAQRLASFATMFYLVTLFTYIKARLMYRGKTSGRAPSVPGAAPLILYLTAIISFILALKTKEIAFTLPAVLAVYEFMFLEGKMKRGLLIVPFLLLTSIIPLSLVGTDIPLENLLGEINEETIVRDSISRTSYLLTEFRVIVTYLRLFFLPVKQNLDYDYPIYDSFFDPQVFISFLLLAAILAAGIYMARSKKSVPLMRLCAFGIFWFFITLSVESSIIPLHVIFEHRMYLPSIGIFITLTTLLYLAAEKLKKSGTDIGRPAVIIFLAVVAALTAATYERNKVWQSHVSLWEDVVKKSPSKARGYNYLGIAYEEKGEIGKAITEYKKCIALDPLYINAYNNLGKAYFEKDLVDNSIFHFKYAIKLDPAHADAHYNLGIAYSAKGMNDLAYREMKLGMRLRGR